MEKSFLPQAMHYIAWKVERLVAGYLGYCWHRIAYIHGRCCKNYTVLSSSSFYA